MRILLVDDDPLVLRQVGRRLTAMGYEVTEAADGATALRLHNERPFPFVILDWVMPEMDGIALCRALRANQDGPYTSILMLTAKDEASDVRMALTAGADDVMRKPIDPDDLAVRCAVAQRIIGMQDRLTAHNRRLHDDLRAASLVQRTLLPDRSLRVPGLDLDWRWQPCEELGGDALGIQRIDEHRTALFLLDVAGHGVRSALLAVQASRWIAQARELHSELLADPQTVLHHLNQQFPFDMNILQYFTMMYGVIDQRSGNFRLGCAGHPGPFLVTSAARTDLTCSSSPIGLIPTAATRFEILDIHLDLGDSVVIFSDGLSEAMDANRVELGCERLLSVLDSNMTASAMSESLFATVQRWENGSAQNDDQSALIVRRTGIV